MALHLQRQALITVSYIRPCLFGGTVGGVVCAQGGRRFLFCLADFGCKPASSVVTRFSSSCDLHVEQSLFTSHACRSVRVCAWSAAVARRPVQRCAVDAAAANLPTQCPEAQAASRFSEAQLDAWRPPCAAASSHQRPRPGDVSGTAWHCRHT